MKRHAFDPFSFVLGLAVAALGLFFLIGDRTAADIGWDWMWPIPDVVLGLLFVISAGRRLMPVREDLTATDDFHARRGRRTRIRLIAFIAVPVGLGVGGRSIVPVLARRRLLDG